MPETGPGFDPSDPSTYERPAANPNSEQFDATDPQDVQNPLKAQKAEMGADSSLEGPSFEGLLQTARVSELVDLFSDAEKVISSNPDGDSQDVVDAYNSKLAVEAEIERRYDEIKKDEGDEAAEGFIETWNQINEIEDDNSEPPEEPEPGIEGRDLETWVGYSESGKDYKRKADARRKELGWTKNADGTWNVDGIDSSSPTEEVPVITDAKPLPDDPEKGDVPLDDSEENSTSRANIYETRANQFKQDEILDTDKLAKIRKQAEIDKAKRKAKREGADKWEEPSEPGKYLPEKWQETPKEKNPKPEDNEDENWDPNDPKAQEAAKDMFDFMSNPYGESKKPSGTDIELWQPPEIQQAEFEAAMDRYTTLATELRLSDVNKTGKLWGKVKGLFSKLNGSSTEVGQDSKLAEMQEAKEEMNKLLNDNALIFCMNLKRKMQGEGKTVDEMEAAIKTFSASGDLENQKMITQMMNEKAKSSRKSKGRLGRWFNDLDKDGNSLDSGKFKKFMKKAATVGLIAGAAGATAGFAVAFAPVTGLAALGVNAAAGLATAYGGGRIGKAIARSGYEQQNRTIGEGKMFANAVDAEGNRDLGAGIDSKATKEREANTKLVKKGQKIGRIAAGIGFGLGRTVGNLTESYLQDSFRNMTDQQKDNFARMAENPGQFKKFMTTRNGMISEYMQQHPKASKLQAEGVINDGINKFFKAAAANNPNSVSPVRFEYPSLGSRVLRAAFTSNVYDAPFAPNSAIVSNATVNSAARFADAANAASGINAVQDASSNLLNTLRW
jgi:hypothetical protein